MQPLANRYPSGGGFATLLIILSSQTFTGGAEAHLILFFSSQPLAFVTAPPSLTKRTLGIKPHLPNVAR